MSFSITEVIWNRGKHYSDVIIGAMASQITSVSIVYSTVSSGADRRKHQSYASLTLAREIDRGTVNSPHKWPLTRKMFPFDDVVIDNWSDSLMYVWCNFSYKPYLQQWFNSTAIDVLNFLTFEGYFGSQNITSTTSLSLPYTILFYICCTYRYRVLIQNDNGETKMCPLMCFHVVI